MEGKKSFLLYCDIIHTIDELTNNQAGELFKIILDYVNDKNPEIKDPLLKIAFTPIKLQLKRDLETWKGTCKKNAENGSKGGRPKNPKNPPLLKKTQKTQRLISKPKKADNDTDNDTDKDNDTDNEILIKKHNEIFRKLWNSDKWIEPLCMKWKCSKKDFLAHLNGFRIDLIAKDQLKENEKDAKNHFVNWVNSENPVIKKDAGIVRSQWEEEFEKNNWW